METIRVLVTGDYSHDDFRSLVADSSVAKLLVPLAEAVDWDHLRWDLVVVSQSRRGQIDQAEVEKIRAAFPLVPIIHLLGSWCEGGERSGFALDGVKRVFWHHWQARLDQFVHQVGLGKKASWQTPATATPADQVAFQAESRDGGETEDGRVGIDTATGSQYAMLADAFRGIGCQPVRIPDATERGPLADGCDLACIDALSLTPRLVEKVLHMKEHLSTMPLVVLLNFPRRDEVEELRRIGVSEVVSKPFQQVDLQWAVDRARLAATEL